MSRTVDDRIVSLEFNNKNFENNVSQTMSTLDKLKQKLNLPTSVKSLDNLNAAANKTNLSGLGAAVDTIQAKFSALQVIGVTALANIANQAVNTGKRMLSALTIDPITAGFQEYETQINAVQTILANTQSKGTTLTDVNAALDELNKYADQTIYNFTEMTRNIGTFTAAGVDLDKSVTSIKGIANLAAVSGSNAQQASTAMYQLSQALAAGKVSLMDWNSVVNAGMGGQLFQDALKRTAENMGTNVDALIEKYGSFRESLTQGEWLTAEVLTETLTQLSGAYTEADLIAQGYTESQAKEITELAETAVNAATKVKTFSQLWDTLKEAAQSGWTQTWEILIGDFEEAKELLTELSDTFGGIIGQQADARNALLYDSMTSNWKKITDGITEAGFSAEEFQTKVEEIATSKGVKVDELVKEYGSLEKAFKNGAISSTYLSEALVSMTGTVSENQKKLEDLRGSYKTNADIINALNKAGYENSDIQELLTKNTEGQTIALNDLTDAQLTSIGYSAEQIASIREISKNYDLANGSLSEFIDNVSKPMGRENLIDALRVSLRSIISVFSEIGSAWSEVFPPATADQVLSITESIKNFALALRPSEETLDKLHRTFRGLFSILDIGKQIISAILAPIGSLAGGFSGLGSSVLDVTASIGDWLYSLSQGLKSGENVFTSIGEGIAAVLDKIFEAIHSLIDGIGGFSGVFSSLGSGISSVFGGIFDVIGGLFDWIREHISIGDIFAGLAGGGIFVLARKISGVIDNIKEAFSGLFGGDKNESGGFTEKFGEVMDSVHESLSAFTTGIKASTLLTIAAAIGILSMSLKSISELESEGVATGLFAIGTMILMLNLSFRSLTKSLSSFGSKGVVKAGVSLVAMSIAISIFASALEKVADLEMEDIAKGLLALGTGLAALVIGAKALNKVKISVSTSIALIAIAEACKILGDALAKFSSLDWNEIAKGLVGMGGSLAIVVTALKVLGKVSGGRTLLNAAGILIAVQALDEISENLEKLGNLSWDQIGRGLTAMGIALGEFTIALGVLSKIGGFGSVLGGTALLIAVQSLDEISENLARLGNLEWDQIGRGLTAMGGALAEIGTVTGVLGKLAGFSGILGGGAILLAVQSLDEISENLERLGNLEWDQIGRGLVAMGGAMAEIAVISGALGALSGFAGLLGAGTILLAVQSLEPIASAMERLGNLSWDQIGRGLVAMGGALAEIAVISGATGALGGFAAIVGAGTITLASQGLGELADAFMKFGSMDWDSIGRGLTAMGLAMGETALGGLLNTFSGFGAGAIAAIAEPLGDLADSVQKWANVKVPDGLGAQLASLAPGIMAFNFSGWGADAIAALATPLGVLADSVQKWTGVVVPDGLGEQLQSLAPGISAFNFSGWGADAIAAVAIPLGNLASSISIWSGITVPENMGATLSDLASGIGSFNFTGWAANDISDVSGPLGELAGAITKWKNVDLPTDMGSKLSSLAEGIKSFNLGWFEGFDVVDAIQPIKDLAGAVKVWNGVNLNMNLGNGLKSFAQGIKEFNNLNLNNIDSVSEALKSVKESISDIEYGDFTEAANAFTSFADSLNSIVISTDTFKNLGKTLVNDFVSSITGALKLNSVSTALLFNTTGVSFATNLNKGFKDNTKQISNTIKTTLSSMVTTIKGYYNSFYQSGKYLVQGFANGISANTYIASAKASAVGGAAAEAIRKRLNERSPSRVAYEIGDYFGIGFVNGISDNISRAYDTSNELADSTRSGLTNVISKIAQAIDTDIDTQPTIRPVVDLTDIRSGINQIGGLFDIAPSVGVLAQANGISMSMNNRQNGSNTDVISAIKDLGRSLSSTMPGNTYNINGITYDDGSNIVDAVQTLVRAARIERRS